MVMRGIIFLQIEELGRLLCNLAAVVPEGIVMFFSSFDYEGLVYEAWKASGILARIQKKKLVFREPRSGGQVELVLKEYREAIAPRGEGPGGALLLAVVGGKVSEGINFSDGMGRCVVMVGLPYPNPSDVELMERVRYIDRLGESTPHPTTLGQPGFEALRSCSQRGREYYENLCMKAVNQSVGKSTIVLPIVDFSLLLPLTILAAVKAERSGTSRTTPPSSWLTPATGPGLREHPLTSSPSG